MKNLRRLQRNPNSGTDARRGTLAVLTALLLVPLIGMLAFSIDIGYLLKKRAELQRAADAAALAAVQDLLPSPDGSQDLDRVRATLRRYVADNISDVDGFAVLESDIRIGRFDPKTVYTNLTILDDGIFDAVQVTVRRDASANAPVPLFFGGIFGIVDSDVSATATAVLQKASILRPGAGVLPFSIPRTDWTAVPPGAVWSIYGDGRILNESGQQLPGNWGTLNLGTSANSTATLNDQVLNGLQQKHLDALHDEGRISTNEYIDSRVAFNANSDPGLSGGMKSSITAVQGQSRLIPIYDSLTNQGANVEFNVTGWAVATVVSSQFKGNNNTTLKIRKTFLYDGYLRPNPDLSVTDGIIEGAYTAPVLVE